MTLQQAQPEKRHLIGQSVETPAQHPRSGPAQVARLPQKTLADLKPLTELMHAHRSGLCSVMDEFCHLYADPIQPCVLPKSLLRLRDPRMDGCDLSVLLQHSKGLTHLVAVTATEAAALEKNTRQQHKSDIWHSTRAGRITIHHTRCCLHLHNQTSKVNCGEGVLSTETFTETD